MKWFYDLKIGKKLLINLSVSILVSLVLCLLGFYQMNNLGRIQDEGFNRTEDALLANNAAHIGTNLYRVVADAEINRNIEESQKIWREEKELNLKNLNDILAKADTESEKDWGNKAKTAVDEFISIFEDKMLPELNSTEETTQEIKDLDAQIDEKVVIINEQLTKFSASLLSEAEESDIQFDNVRKSAVAVNISISLIFILLLTFLSIFIIQNIKTPLRNLSELAEKVAEGEVNTNIVVSTKDEIGDLMNSFRKMTQSIKSLVDEAGSLTQKATEGKLDARGNEDKFKGGYKEIVIGINRTLDAIVEPIKESALVLKEVSKGNMQISVNGNYKGEHAEIKNTLNETIMSLNEALLKVDFSANQVALGSNQVSSSGQALSQGAAEQASSLEEITVSMTQVTEQTKTNALNANQANELALTAKENAISGNDQMKEMLKAMQDINNSSSDISKIIKVIDEIAFQTNILALNAAVEAARAGQHGKGFAVVAEEVRNLAARSANAAKETTSMIENSMKTVEYGTKIASETAEALDKIVEGVTKAVHLVGGITSASNEQAEGIRQINAAIEQVSQVVQTNSATAQESAASSEELSSQAQMLKETIGKFKLNKKRGFSDESSNSMNPELLHMIEEMINKKSPTFSMNSTSVNTEPAKCIAPIINLDDSFGKY